MVGCDLTSRGIKSSMKDPIKVIQVVLDKIFNHLLYFLELEFVKQFNVGFPSVNGVDEDLVYVRASRTGDWVAPWRLKGILAIFILTVTMICWFLVVKSAYKTVKIYIPVYLGDKDLNFVKSH